MNLSKIITDPVPGRRHCIQPSTTTTKRTRSTLTLARAALCGRYTLASSEDNTSRIELPATALHRFVSGLYDRHPQHSNYPPLNKL